MEIDLDYWYDQHLIQIKTLNLNVNWREIERRLREGGLIFFLIKICSVKVEQPF